MNLELNSNMPQGDIMHDGLDVGLHEQSDIVVSWKEYLKEKGLSTSETKPAPVLSHEAQVSQDTTKLGIKIKSRRLTRVVA